MGRLALVLSLLAFPAGAADYFTLDGHGGPVMAVAVSEGGLVATASFDNAVGVWRDGDPTWLDGHEAAVNTVVFDGEGVAWSGGDDYALLRWDLETGAARRFSGHRGKVMNVAIGDGLVATASWDGTVGLWPAEGSARFLAGHDGPVNDVAFTADGAGLYSASADGTIRLWDLRSGQEVQRVVEHGFGVNEIVLNEEAGWLAYGAVDGGTRALDLETGAALADLTLERRPILAMEASGDGALIAVGDGEGYIMVVDTAAWRIANDFRATTRGPIWALAFSPDGSRLLAGGLDSRVHGWPIAALGEAGAIEPGKTDFLADPETMPNGERQFKRKCSICHTLTPGSARRAGPSLHGLFGRRAGTVADYVYSPALTGLDLVWDAGTIDALFDIGPEHYVPGTKMPMQRITAARDRADLIAYLRAETAKE